MALIGGLRLTVTYGGKLQKTVTLAQDCIFLGRLLTCHLPVEDPKVSRMHSVIEVREGKEVMISDLDSSNGTRVNGKQQKTTTLGSGDTVGIGDSEIKVEFLSTEQISRMPAIVYQSGISRGVGQQSGVETVMLSIPAIKGQEINITHDDIDNILSQLEPATVRASAGKPGPAIGKIGAKKGTEKVVKGKGTTSKATASKSSTGKTTAANAITHRTPLDPAKQERALKLLRGMGTAMELKVQWGEEILDVQHLDKPEVVTVGTRSKNTYIIPAFEAYPKQMPFLSPQKGHSGYFNLGFSEGMEGWVHTGDKLNSLQQLKQSPRTHMTHVLGDKVYLYPLTSNDKGMVSVENLALCFQTVRAFPEYHSPASKPDRRPIWVMLFYFLLMVLSALVPLPVPEVTIAEQVKESMKAIDVIYARERARSVLGTMASKELRDIGSKLGEKTGKATVGENQKGNVKDTKVGGAEGARSVGPRAPDLPGVQSGETLAKALDALKSDDITRLLGRTNFAGGGIGSSNNASNVTSAARLFSSIGGGLKSTGTGGGTGGGGGESVDIGGIGTKGRGSGAGGYGTVRLGEKLEASIDSDGEGVDVRGALDRELIRRVVERNKNQIQFCYDTKLQLSKGRGRPSGRVVVGWTIAPSGRVVSTSKVTSTMNDSAFETCLMDRVRTWIFPEPKGGGIVKVEYPFVFKPST